MIVKRHRLRITNRLVNGSCLIAGRGFLSNTHWVVRTKFFRRIDHPAATEQRPLTARKAVGFTGQRFYKVQRVPGHEIAHGYPVVQFVGRGGRLRVWLNKAYADAMGLTGVAYAPDDHGPVLDGNPNWNPDAWSVGVMAVRV